MATYWNSSKPPWTRHSLRICSAGGVFFLSGVVALQALSYDTDSRTYLCRHIFTIQYCGSLLFFSIGCQIFRNKSGGGMRTTTALWLPCPQAIRHPSNFRVVQSKFSKSGNLVQLNIVLITYWKYSPCSNCLQSFYQISESFRICFSIKLCK